MNKAYQGMQANSSPLSLEEAQQIGASEELVAVAQKTEEKFLRAMADDFNTGAGISLSVRIGPGRSSIRGRRRITEA